MYKTKNRAVRLLKGVPSPTAMSGSYLPRTDHNRYRATKLKHRINMVIAHTYSDFIPLRSSIARRSAEGILMVPLYAGEYWLACR
jgi:hypothetical protein